MTVAPPVIEKLREIVGQQRVLTDETSFQQYGVDRTTLWSPSPGVVVLPGSTEEVQAIIQAARSLQTYDSDGCRRTALVTAPAPRRF